METCLLIDISNSLTKLVSADHDRLTGPVQKIPTPELTPERLAATPELGKPQVVVLSSVVPAANEAVAAFAKAQGARLLIVGHEVELGIALDYPEPASIGADRLANAAGAARFYGAPAVVIDFGTALTFDIIASQEGRATYTGGVIAPGLEAMTHYLHQRTALLPRIDLSEPEHAIGRSTKEAMLSGAVYGYRGLVREILTAIRRELGHPRELEVVATGGYAGLIVREMPEIARLHPNLTLEGLRLIAALNRE